jgi:hypothetical protein
MALLPGIGIGLGSALKKGLEAAYKASKNKSSSSSSGGSSGSKASSITPTVTGPRNIATRDYFEDKGYEVKWNDKTGTIEVVDPRTGHAASITKGFYNTIGGTSYISPDMTKRVEETIGSGKYKSPGYSSKSTKKTYTPHEVIDLATGMIGPMLGMATPAPIAAPMTALGEMVGIVGGEFAKGAYDIARSGYAPEYYMQEHLKPIYYLQEQFPKYDWNPQYDSIETAPVYKKYLDQALETITAYETQLMEMLKQQMGGVDPATQAALASLKESIQKQRDNLMEEMSRRGLLQSGLWLEMEDRLNKGEMTAQQQLIAGRLSELQNQMNQALQNFTAMRLNAAQAYGIAGAQAAERQALARQEAMERQLQRELDEAYRKQQLGLSQFQTYAPYLYLTEAQRQSLPLDWAQVMGQVPVGPGYEPIPARNYVGDSNIDYDSKTGEVIIGGQRINPSAVGGYINNSTAYIPKNIIDNILRRLRGM